jgi:hypothetical protein
VSPDRMPAPGIGIVVSAATRRMRLLAIAEGVAWGVAAAAIWLAAGAAMAAAVIVWRWRAASRAYAIRALERAQPDARNLFVTADELERGALAAKPAVRERVVGAAAAKAGAIDLSAAFSTAPVWRAAAAAAVAWAIAISIGLLRGPLATIALSLPAGSAPLRTTAPAGQLRVAVTIEPPSYTGLQPATVVDPEQLQAVEGASLVLSVQSPARDVRLEHDGTARPLSREAAGRFSARLLATKTGFLVVTADDGERRVLPVVVAPDALPAVRVTAPGRDLVYAGGNPLITFEAHATDDFGLRSLSLRYTRVSGSGETFEFQDGDIPLTVTRTSARDWKGEASRSLADLNLKDGDMLVYRGVAADARPGDGSASSDAFFIEISRLGAAAGDAFTLPEEETRYALSQQMLIVKTERLHQRQTTMAHADIVEAALNLAVEQRMIRAEFVFMLGGEVEDEEVEAQRSTELQEGRLENRGQRDLRAATIAMSQAEKLLTGADTAAALAAERAAVAALQRAFTRERYILRALATRTQLDPARRLTGSLATARDWRRSAPEPAASRRTALLQDLLRGLAELAGGTAPFRERALVLAEEAIRIDPNAPPLREVAAALQRAAGATDATVRSTAVAAATTAAASEARRAHADAPLARPALAPALNGSFADALRGGRR